jgi:putative membrane protein
MRPSELLGADGRERIVAAVREAEKTTSGEIVVAVVRQCDEYGAAGWRCGATLAALAYLGAALFLPSLATSAYLAIQVAALGLGHLAARIAPIRRVFISEATMQERAERRAAAAFAELGLRHTERQVGILILVALLEHRVVVLADRGINEALGPDESWEEIVELVLSGIRSGQPADGIVAAVGRCGEILAHPLPASANDRDEIRRELVIED